MVMDEDEYLEIVNEKGEIIGSAQRSEIHGNPSLMHKVVHVLVFNRMGNLLLQRRSQKKDVAPGKWDTSVGGHVEAGEALLVSCKREMQEELGITEVEPEYLYSYVHRNNYESELVTTYRCVYDGEISFNMNEIDEIRFWKIQEIKEAMGQKIFSDNFEDEARNYMSKYL
jgi:isopentenyl-diphosphate delta-isomerase type 1